MQTRSQNILNENHCIDADKHETSHKNLLLGFVVISLFMLSGQVKASWMDDWVSQSSSSGPSYWSPRFQVPSFLAPNQMLSLALLVWRLVIFA
jgi:hypothetical protein